MKVAYDKEVDAIYLEISKLEPEGVIEVSEGINIDVTTDGRIVGIELLDATRKISLDALLSYEIESESLGELSIAKARINKHASEHVTP